MNSNSQSGFDTKEKVLEVAREQLAGAVEAHRANRISGRQMEQVRTGAALRVANTAMREIGNPPAKMLDRLDLLNALIAAGARVVAAWECGDLAGAVRELDAAVADAKEGI